MFHAACFRSVVLAVAVAVDSLCMSLCGCLCVLLFAQGTKAALMCANLHGTITRQTCLQYDFTIMREIFIAGGHTASNAPDLFRPPKLSSAGPGLELGCGAAREDLRVLTFVTAASVRQPSGRRFHHRRLRFGAIGRPWELWIGRSVEAQWRSG